MDMRRTAVRGLAWSLVMALPLAACNRGPSQEVQQELTTLRAQRDSLIREEAAKSQTMERLSQALESIQGASGSGALPPESLRDRITAIATERDNARNELATAQRRIRSLARQRASLRDSLQNTRAMSDSLLAMQRDSISSLHSSMSMTEDSLSQQVAAVSDTLRGLEKEHYTVYYTVGTAKELLDRGVVTKEGGARFLGFLWKRGQSLVPARSLQTDEFKAIDLRTTTDIQLPAQGTYKLVSRQDVQYLNPTPDAAGEFTAGDLKVTDPQNFWRHSRFLILERVQ
jgi:hypothetical protein